MYTNTYIYIFIFFLYYIYLGVDQWLEREREREREKELISKTHRDSYINKAVYLELDCKLMHKFHLQLLNQNTLN